MIRPKPALVALPLFLFFGCMAFAQKSSRATQANAEIQVRVVYDNERPVNEQVRLELLSGAGVPAEQTYTNDQGQASFHVAGGSSYRVRVSGADIKEAVSEVIELDPAARFRTVSVHVQPRDEETASGRPSNERVTSASGLKVPSDARKLFNKGVTALQHREFERAAELFEKATTSYPQYDSAFDNLGVAWMRLGQTDKAQAAFEHAVQLNDKNPDADRNYSRLLISNQQYARAADYLRKSLMVDPLNASTLALLAIAQFQAHDYAGALQSALRVHQLPHQGCAIAHYIAGSAYEINHRYQEATAEFQLYLKESPDGPDAGQVRASLARVTTNLGKQAQ